MNEDVLKRFDDLSMELADKLAPIIAEYPPAVIASVAKSLLFAATNKCPPFARPLIAADLHAWADELASRGEGSNAKH